VNGSCGEQADQEVVIPGCELATPPEGVLASGIPDQVVGDVPDGGDVLRGVFGSDPTFIVAEGHVHDPVQAVRDFSVAAHDRPQDGCGGGQGGKVKTGLALDPVVEFPAAFDHDDCVQPGPGMALL
jgi:hypothetical protein